MSTSGRTTPQFELINHRDTEAQSIAESVEFQMYRTRQFPLLLIEAVEGLATKLQGRSYMQDISTARAHFRCGLPRELKSAGECLGRQWAQLQYADSQITDQVIPGSLRLRG